MEFSVGQFTQKGPIGAMKRLCPLLKGTGIATVVISFFLTTYYIVIIAWAMFYIFSSFTYELPWKTCNNSWNTQNCWDDSSSGSRSFNLTKIKSIPTNYSRTPSEEFFK